MNAQAPINNLDPARTAPPPSSGAQLDLVNRLNRRDLARHPHEADLAARIESFELAYRMQMAAPEALDVNRESKTRELYGLDDKKSGHSARQCLMARRLVERGVRFVQIYWGGMENERSWDGYDEHQGQPLWLRPGETDWPIAGLLADLKSRGLLDQTLVICNGEFGRLPIVQEGGTGCDHNPHAFTTLLAGGGSKAGARHGATDEIGHKAVVDKVSINDLHATVLHLLGIDHERLTYRFNGRNFRLTDVAGHSSSEVVA